MAGRPLQDHRRAWRVVIDLLAVDLHVRLLFDDLERDVLARDGRDLRFGDEDPAATDERDGLVHHAIEIALVADGRLTGGDLDLAYPLVLLREELALRLGLSRLRRRRRLLGLRLR